MKKGYYLIGGVAVLGITYLIVKNWGKIKGVVKKDGGQSDNWVGKYWPF